MNRELVEELKSASRLRRLSPSQIPEAIGGSKTQNSLSPCALHAEILAKVQIIQSIEKDLLRTKWLHDKQEREGDLAWKHLMEEVREFKRCEYLVLPTTDPMWKPIHRKIRKRLFQLEPIMYEDFYIL